MLNFSNFIGKFVKSSNQRELERIKTIIEKVNGFEPKVQKITDSDFPVKTKELKQKISSGNLTLLAFYFK